RAWDYPVWHRRAFEYLPAFPRPDRSQLAPRWRGGGGATAARGARDCVPEECVDALLGPELFRVEPQHGRVRLHRLRFAHRPRQVRVGREAEIAAREQPAFRRDDETGGEHGDSGADEEDGLREPEHLLAPVLTGARASRLEAGAEVGQRPDGDRDADRD